MRNIIDTLIGALQFSRVIKDQAEVKSLLKSEDPNLISFLETSLFENEHTR